MKPSICWYLQITSAHLGVLCSIFYYVDISSYQKEHPDRRPADYEEDEKYVS